MLGTDPEEAALLPHVHRITKYDPAHRDARGYYTGPEDTISDHGPVESAYLSAVAALARESGVEYLEIREPGLPGAVSFGLEPSIEGYGLAGLEQAMGPHGFHDGARVTLAVALELVRTMLRDHGLWCRLEAEGRFAVHVGWDQYLYVGAARPLDEALARVRALGLFAEPIDVSPYDASLDDEPGTRRLADHVFWDRLRRLVQEGEAGVLQEEYAVNASRWHLLRGDTLERTRAGLAPRSCLAVWPRLTEDVAAVLAGLPEEGYAQVLWQGSDGRVRGELVDEEQHGELAVHLADARSALALPVHEDQSPALFTGIVPDPDGVLRARWATDPCPGDSDWPDDDLAPGDAPGTASAPAPVTDPGPG